MPEMQSQELSAADIRRLLREKFPPKTDDKGNTVVDREYVLTSIVIAMAEHAEEQEKRIDKFGGAIQEMGAVVSIVAQATGIDIAQVVAAVRAGVRPTVTSTEEEGEEGEEDILGATAGGPGGAAGAGGGGSGAGAGGAAGGANPVTDKTPFPAGASPNVKPGDPAQKVAAQVPKVDKPVTPTNQNENDEEDEHGIPKPNVTSAGPKNAAPIPSGPPPTKGPSPNGAKAQS